MTIITFDIETDAKILLGSWIFGRSFLVSRGQSQFCRKIITFDIETDAKILLGSWIFGRSCSFLILLFIQW